MRTHSKLHIAVSVLLALATVASLLSIISDNWLTYRVNPSTPSVNSPLQFYTRYRGLFHTCSDKDVEPTPLIDQNYSARAFCVVMHYEIPPVDHDIAPSSNYIKERDLLRATVVMFPLYAFLNVVSEVLITASACTVTYERRSRVLISSAAFVFGGVFSGLSAMATWFFAMYYDHHTMQTTDMQPNMLAPRLSWPDVIRANTTITNDWSFYVMCAALAMSLIGGILTVVTICLIQKLDKGEPLVDENCQENAADEKNKDDDSLSTLSDESIFDPRYMTARDIQEHGTGGSPNRRWGQPYLPDVDYTPPQARRKVLRKRPRNPKKPHSVPTYGSHDNRIQFDNMGYEHSPSSPKVDRRQKTLPVHVAYRAQKSYGKRRHRYGSDRYQQSRDRREGRNSTYTSSSEYEPSVPTRYHSSRFVRSGSDRQFTRHPGDPNVIIEHRAESSLGGTTEEFLSSDRSRIQRRRHPKNGAQGLNWSFRNRKGDVGSVA